MHPCDTKTDGILDSIRTGNRLREIILPLYWSPVKHIWSFLFILGSIVQEKHEANPEKGHKCDYKIGALDIKGKVEKNGIFQPGEGSGEKEEPGFS